MESRLIAIRTDRKSKTDEDQRLEGGRDLKGSGPDENPAVKLKHVRAGGISRDIPFSDDPPWP
jgi:hypothetical protein